MSQRLAFGLLKVSCAALLAFAAVGGGVQAANLTPYYLFDGFSSVGYEITNGAVANTFSTFEFGYPVAIRNTIWLGDINDAGAKEYNLNGTATGNTSTGGTNFSQLLDGATGPANNYGITCCRAPNVVTVANGDWSGQASLFNIGVQGTGIAYDLSNNTLYTSDLISTVIVHYDLAGNVLGSFNIGQPLVGLAYETVTDTLWGFNVVSDNLVQFSKTGSVLQDVDIAGFSPGNPFGGEMANAVAVPVPEPASAALLGFAIAALGFARRKRAA
jgi:hypothetical protein